MVALKKGAENPKSSYPSKLRSAVSTAKDNDTARIKACVDARAPISEIVDEAYRLCRINGHIRRDIRKVKDDLQLAEEFKKRQAVREDALAEMREDLLKTQKLLERTWGYLEHRDIKVPADMRAAYKALNTRDFHDWQPQKGMKKSGTQSLQGGKRTNANGKQKQKTQRKKMMTNEPRTAFLLHMDEGTTRNFRDPPIDTYTDDDTDDEAESPPVEANDDAEDKVLTQQSQPQGLIADNAIAYSEPELPTNLFASLKKPKVDTEPVGGGAHSNNSTIFTPIVEGAFGAKNTIAGVKRKNTLINDSTEGAMKKAWIDLNPAEVKTGTAGALSRTINSETTMTSDESNHHSTEETRRDSSETTAVTPTTAGIDDDLEEGEIDERGLVHDA